MKDETILYGVLGIGGLYLLAKSGAIEQIGAGLGKTAGSVGEIGAGLGYGLSGLRETFAGLGSAFSQIGGGVYQIGGGAGTALAGIGVGTGTGLAAIGSGTGYAISGINPQDIIQTILNLGKEEASTYRQPTPQDFTRQQEPTETKKIPITPTEQASTASALERARQNFLAAAGGQAQSNYFTLSGGSSAQAITRFVEQKTTAQAPSKQTPTLTKIYQKTPLAKITETIGRIFRR